MGNGTCSTCANTILRSRGLHGERHVVNVRHNHSKVMRTEWGHIMVKILCNHDNIISIGWGRTCAQPALEPYQGYEDKIETHDGQSTLFSRQHHDCMESKTCSTCGRNKPRSRGLNGETLWSNTLQPRQHHGD